MDFAKFGSLLKKEKIGETRLLEPMSKHTTWRIGGPADILFSPLSGEVCRRALQMAYEYGVPVTFLGAGSNILVADQGIRGLVLQTRGLEQRIWLEQTLTTQGGASLAGLSREACAKCLSGLEFAAGIPGSTGGAVLMNAGAHGSSLGELVEEVSTLTIAGVERVYRREELNFGYRSSLFRGKNELIMQVKLVLQPGELAHIKDKMEEYLHSRRGKQPLNLPNAGSVFRNPPGKSAGQLIEEAGLKGMRIGDAQVSELHGNFIVNLGKAQASQVVTLIEEVRKIIEEKSAIQLETEVVFLGFDDTRR